MDFTLEPFEFAKQWMPQLFGALVKIREKRRREIDFIADVFGDPLDLAKYYIEPSCQQVNPVDYAEDENVVREPMFQRLEAFISGESSRGKRHMFVLSDAGMGKTSLLVMLKLAHLTAFWPKDHECVLLKLGKTTLQDVEAVVEKRRTVLLLDALDEDPLAWKRTQERLGELLRATDNFRRVIITCRTQFFSANGDPFNRRGQVEVAGFVCSAIYCSLFSDQQVRLFLQKRFADKFENAEWRDRVQRIMVSMGFLRMRPMLLAHIEDLMAAEETIWNEYTILRTLIDAWLLREHRKAPNPPPEFSKQLKRACRHIAVQMMLSGRNYTTAKQQEVLDYVWSQVNSYDGFSVGGRSLLNKDSDGNYRFSHFSIQECLVVEYIVGNPGSEHVKKLRITSFMSKIALAWLKVAPASIRSGRRFSVFDFSGLNFSGMELSGVDLSGVRLENAEMAGCVLGGGKPRGRHPSRR